MAIDQAVGASESVWHCSGRYYCKHKHRALASLQQSLMALTHLLYATLVILTSVESQKISFNVL